MKNNLRLLRNGAGELCLFGFLSAAISACIQAAPGPNILWITCEDLSPHLIGCYHVGASGGAKRDARGGDQLAHTPNLDHLASQGVRFTRAYANAPVCGVARSALLTGMHSSTLGTQHMRSRPQLPEQIPAYPRLLREAGYYCTNNSKTDYNSSFEDIKQELWDETSSKAHWENRPEGKPFFAIFNITQSHESQISDKRWAGHIKSGLVPEKHRLNPATIPLPPYHPDLPAVREDWARLYDQATMMDTLAGQRLDELEEAGLAEDTIVFFYSDHGGHLARSKRYIYNGGTHVPFIVRFPEKWRHLAPGQPGTTNDELVQFIDITKTVLSLAGVEPPDLMQGRIFTGPEQEPAHATLHFYRDRMAERYDLSRAVTDGRFYFIRNFMPHRPRGRDSEYGYTVQKNWGAWRDWFEANSEAAGPVRSQFFRPKPRTQFFDLESDPWQVTNLADDADQEARIKQLQAGLDAWMIATRDTGLIPEPLFHDLAGPGKAHRTIYEYAQSDAYPVETILQAAKTASAGDANRVDACLGMMNHGHPVMRHWGAYGLFLARQDNLKIQEALKRVIEDDAYAANRIAAAQALGRCGDPETAFAALMEEAGKARDGYVFLFALNALQYSHTDDRLTLDDWKRFQEQNARIAKNAATRDFGYAGRIITDAIALWPERRKVD